MKVGAGSAARGVKCEQRLCCRATRWHVAARATQALPSDARWTVVGWCFSPSNVTPVVRATPRGTWSGGQGEQHFVSPSLVPVWLSSIVSHVTHGSRPTPEGRVSRGSHWRARRDGGHWCSGSQAPPTLSRVRRWIRARQALLGQGQSRLHHEQLLVCVAR